MNYAQSPLREGILGRLKRVTTDGISLKSFNNVFGYYIEVRNLHKDKVPAGGLKTNLSECGALYYKLRNMKLRF
jgi:hypothetical protein